MWPKLFQANAGVAQSRLAITVERAVFFIVFRPHDVTTWPRVPDGHAHALQLLGHRDVSTTIRSTRTSSTVAAAPSTSPSTVDLHWSRSGRSAEFRSR